MGLLEQAQVQKSQFDEENQLTKIDIESFDEIQGSGLLARAHQSKIKKETTPSSKKNSSDLLKKFYEPHDLIEEQVRPC